MGQRTLSIVGQSTLGFLQHRGTAVKCFETEKRFGRKNNKGVSGMTLEIHSTLSRDWEGLYQQEGDGGRVDRR